MLRYGPKIAAPFVLWAVRDPSDIFPAAGTVLLTIALDMMGRRA